MSRNRLGSALVGIWKRSGDVIRHMAPLFDSFEFGCGTGKLAAQILELVPPTASYLVVDISPVMVDLATRHSRRGATAHKCASSMGRCRCLPTRIAPTASSPRTFMDLLDDSDAVAVLREFERILTNDALVCLVSLRPGITRFERLVSALWTMVLPISEDAGTNPANLPLTPSTVERA